MTAPRIDWPRLLGDIAYMLGEPDPGNPDVRVPCSQERLASALGVARGTLRGVFTLDQAEQALQAARRLAGVGQVR